MNKSEEEESDLKMAYIFTAQSHSHCPSQLQEDWKMQEAPEIEGVVVFFGDDPLKSHTQR